MTRSSPFDCRHCGYRARSSADSVSKLTEENCDPEPRNRSRAPLVQRSSRVPSSSTLGSRTRLQTCTGSIRRVSLSRYTRKDSLQHLILQLTRRLQTVYRSQRLPIPSVISSGQSQSRRLGLPVPWLESTRHLKPTCWPRRRRAHPRHPQHMRARSADSKPGSLPRRWTSPPTDPRRFQSAPRSTDTGWLRTAWTATNQGHLARTRARVHTAHLCSADRVIRAASCSRWQSTPRPAIRSAIGDRASWHPQRDFM